MPVCAAVSCEGTIRSGPCAGAMARTPTVLHLTGPLILDWGNGVRLQLSPAGVAVAPAVVKGRPGRKPSPATQALQKAMAEDAQAGRKRSRAAYLQVLRDHGHNSSASAGAIVAREAKRHFGAALGRSPKRARGRGGGRQASPATAELRQKMADDAAKGELRDVNHYVRWLVDKAGIGLKKARPIVYRELRRAKQ